jgi:hypothetical protein
MSRRTIFDSRAVQEQLRATGAVMSLKNNLAATKRKMDPNSNPAETPALGDDRPGGRVPAKLRHQKVCT